VVRLLVENGASVTGWIETGLSKAVFYGNVAMVRLLLEKGVDIEGRGPGGRTMLHMAAIIGNEAMVELLVRKGADIGARDSYGRTAVQYALWKKSLRLFQLLTPPALNSQSISTILLFLSHNGLSSILGATCHLTPQQPSPLPITAP
jgi:ankyrin repeat protein